LEEEAHRKHGLPDETKNDPKIDLEFRILLGKV
jgi:hypothetical protein